MIPAEEAAPERPLSPPRTDADAAMESQSAAAPQKAVPQKTAPEAGESWLGINHSDQLTIGLVMLALIVLLPIRWYQTGAVERSSIQISRETPTPGYQIDLNSATWPELTQLDGIGPSLAQRIVEDRERDGPFRSVGELTRVKGLGPKLLERNRRWLRAGSQDPGSANTHR